MLSIRYLSFALTSTKERIIFSLFSTLSQVLSPEVLVTVCQMEKNKCTAEAGGMTMFP